MSFLALSKAGFTARERQVLDALMGRADRHGVVRAQQKEIAADLGMTQAQVSLAVGRIEEKGFVSPVSRGVYRLSPGLALRPGDG